MTVDVANPSEPVALSAAGGRYPRVRRLLRDRGALAGLVVVTAMSAAALLAPLLAPHDPNAVDVARKLNPPSAQFPLGTDQLGRDVLSRLLYGARVSLTATVVAATAITALGLLLGLLAGFFGGLVDAVISRTMDVLLAFPTFLLALGVVGALGPGLRNLMVAVVAVWWAAYARVVRAATLAERERPYVTAARSVGAGPLRILARHLLPNVLGPVAVLTSLDLAAVMLGISAFSFLGLGMPATTPEWGRMLAEARTYVNSAPALMLAPGGAIFLTALGFNLLGDGVRDALDPRVPN